MPRVRKGIPSVEKERKESSDVFNVGAVVAINHPRTEARGRSLGTGGRMSGSRTCERNSQKRKQPRQEAMKILAGL